MASDDQFSPRVLDGCAAPGENTMRFMEELDTTYEDAGKKEDPEKGDTAFVFAEGLVALKGRAVGAGDAEVLPAKVTELDDAGTAKVMEGHPSCSGRHSRRD